MTRTLSKILILVLMVVVFFAPVGASFEKKDNQIAFNVEVNKANADDINGWSSLGDSKDFSCSFISGASFYGCFAWFIYWVIFSPISFLAGLAAQFLDYFIYYSTNSTSYSSNFVGVAWGAVRDIANIFFIIGLLYVAIETILGIGHNGKKMIASIIVVALLINFSLFFTQVVIDTSNILARVFYNNIDAINKDKSLAIGSSGEKSISTALVSMFEPQQIISKDQYQNHGIGTFITVTLLASVVSAIMLWVFLATALMFVARVAGLYISMIFAPIAFASYTVPFDIPGLGHKEWWSNLLKQAFLAPIFIFFLYVILLFRDAFKTIFGDVKSATDGISLTDAGHINGLLKVIIPFAIVTVLLLRAKKLAVEYSGTIGESFSKAGSFIAGAATGGIIGAYAGIGRSSLGYLGNKVAKSSLVNRLSQDKYVGFVGRGITNAGKFVGSSSFDVRGTGLVSGVGQAQKGGYVASIKKNSDDRLRQLEQIKEGANKDLKGEIRKAEETAKALELSTHNDITKLDEEITAARQKLSDINKMPELDPADKAKKESLKKRWNNELDGLNDEKAALKKGEDYKITRRDPTSDDPTKTKKINKEYSKTAVINGKTLSASKKDLHDLKHKLEHEEINLGVNFVTNQSSTAGRWMSRISGIVTGGSVAADKDSEHRIRMDMKPPKEEKGGGDHGGGSHGGGSHAPKPAAKAPTASGGHGGGGAAHH